MYLVSLSALAFSLFSLVASSPISYSPVRQILPISQTERLEGYLTFSPNNINPRVHLMKIKLRKWTSYLTTEKRTSFRGKLMVGSLTTLSMIFTLGLGLPMRFTLTLRPNKPCVQKPPACPDHCRLGIGISFSPLPLPHSHTDILYISKRDSFPLRRIQTSLLWENPMSEEFRRCRNQIKNLWQNNSSLHPLRILSSRLYGRMVKLKHSESHSINLRMGETTLSKVHRCVWMYVCMGLEERWDSGGVLKVDREWEVFNLFYFGTRQEIGSRRRGLNDLYLPYFLGKLNGDHPNTLIATP